MESEQDEGKADQAFSATSSSYVDEPEADLEPDFLDLMVSQDDQDALLVSSFEGELEEYFQETPEMHAALIS